LQSLLAHAAGRSAICLACDMPYVTAALLVRLATAAQHADVLAPRDPATGKWQPLCARYHGPSVAPVLESALAGGERSFQGLFRRMNVAELPLDASERAQLRDWDTPEDMRAAD
jgi:molybdopterin-guanine dinucleotide biosynthesis protein A